MIWFILTYGIATAEVQAEGVRHQEAHEHGVAHMNVAFEGDTLYIEFTSPAVNIVGFEHRPQTREQKKAIEMSIAKLKTGDKLFKLSPKAKAKLSHTIVDTDIADASIPKSDAEHNAEHGQHHGKDNNHGEEQHDSNAHDRHSDFKAEYRFVCQRPEKLTQIDVMLFSLFPAIEHIEVQVLTEKKQTALELTTKRNKITLMN